MKLVIVKGCKTAVVLWLVLLVSAVGIAQEEWKLAKEKNGITVYTKISEGSNLKAYKAITTLTGVKLSDVAAVIMDSENSERWVADIKHATVVKNIAEHHRLTYYLSELPWPFSNRDMVLEGIMSQNQETKEVMFALKSMHDEAKENDDVVRMKVAEGFWKLSVLKNGDIYVEHEFLADPAGNIPTWLINLFFVDGPITTLTNLKNYLPNNIAPKLSFIED